MKLIKTEIIKVNSSAAVNKSASVLKKGGIIIYPTDTSYGIGADCENRKAVRNVYRIKMMEPGKKISAACSSLSMAKKYFNVSPAAEKLARKFLPGPLTIITKGRSFRIPEHDFVLKLVKKLGRPVTSTSANISKKGDIYSSKKIIKLFDGAVDIIIDAGTLRKRRPSTVFDVDRMKVVRKGPVSVKSILKALS